MKSSNFSERRASFRKLHQSGCFIIPNPWNAGAAKLLASVGFKALATTSSGFAWSRGARDGSMSVDDVLKNCREIVSATPLPVNADFEDGHASDPGDVGANVLKLIETGIAGFSIEDSTGDPGSPLYDVNTALARLRAARNAIDQSGEDVMLIARAECFLVRHADPLAESLRRLKAYATAGADCLYAPGLSTLDQIDAVVEAVAPKPVNVLVGGAPSYSLQDLAAHGVRRISVGGALARVALGSVLGAAKSLAEGRFDAFAGIPGFVEIQKLMN